MTTSRIYRSAFIVALALLLGLLSPLSAGARVEPDREPGSPVRYSNAALASSPFESVFNSRDDTVAETLLTADAVIQTPYGEFTGPQGLLDYLGIIHRGYPDASFSVSSIDARGDTVVVRWTMTATRFQVDPTEPVTDVLVRMPGETTITVADGQVSGMTQTQQVAAITSSSDIAFTYGPAE